MATGHITQLQSLHRFDLRRMAFLCGGPRCLCRATGGTGLWPLCPQPHGRLGPKALQGQLEPGNQSLSFIDAEVGARQPSEGVTTP